MPGAVRPARPRRWSADARDTRTVSSRVIPTSGSKRGTRANAAVNDDANAFNGDRGFGDRRCKHDFPATSLRGGNGSVLRRGVKSTVQGNDVYGFWQRSLGKPFGDARNLSLAPEETRG